MKNQDFIISFTTVWILVIGNALLTIASAISIIQHWEYTQTLFTVSLMLFFTTWVIVLNDMLKYKIYNKTYWVFMMFIMPTIAAIFYLFQRNRLIRLGQKLRWLFIKLPSSHVLLFFRKTKKPVNVQSPESQRTRP